MAEEPEAGFSARVQGFVRGLIGAAPEEKEIEAKDIWGPSWRAFMGITDGGGTIKEVGNQPQDQLDARTNESYVFRCIDVRGKAISQVPLRIWEEDRITGKRRAIDHEALDILRATNPMGYVDGLSTLMRYTLGSLDLSGRCTWRMAFDRKGIPSEVYWQVPSLVQPLHGFDKKLPKIPFWGVRIGADLDIPAEEIVYFTTDNPADPILGTSKVAVLRQAINLRAYSQKSNLDFFKNSMRPDWLLHGAFRNTEENVERIRRAIRRHLSGESNRMPLILGENMTAQLLTTAHNDAEWLGQQRLSQEEIAAAFGVPVIYMNNLERATFDNINTAKLILWHDTMIPEGDALAETLTRRYLWKFWPDAVENNYAFGFDYNAIEGLGEDVARIWERFKDFRVTLTQEVVNRQVTPNQARQQLAQLATELGFDPTPYTGDVPGGDVHFVPFQHIPIDQAGVQAVIDIYAARGPNPELEADVPGAPTAGDRADDPRPSGGTAPAADTSSSPAPQNRNSVEDFAEFKAKVDEILNRIDKPTWEAPVSVKELPHPIPIRDARLAPIQKRLEGRLKAYFQDLQNASLRTLRGLKAKPIDQGSLGRVYDTQESHKELTLVLRDGINESGQAAFDAAQKDFGLPGDAEASWLDGYMGQRIGLIQEIDDTTANSLRKSLLEGLLKGEDSNQMAARVSAVFRTAIDSRAAMIARTETMQAYAAASLAAYGRSGVNKVRMFDGPNDDSADCINVDGQIVSLAEAARLMSEEHPNGTRAVAPYIETSSYHGDVLRIT